MTSTLTFAGSEMDAVAAHAAHASPAKARKSFGITRKASAVKLSGLSHEKPFSTSDTMLATTTTPKEKKLFQALQIAKDDCCEIKGARYKFEQELLVSKLPSAPSTPTGPRFSQALFVPPAESAAPSQVFAYRVPTLSENPCLFIAFEQALKSGVLTAPSIPPELIVRYQHDVEVRSERRSRYLRKGSLSRSLDIHYTQKLFILAPGLLIQYSSEGSYDREPERVLRLRPDSLTFASDIFEGKHFVLHITSTSPEASPLSADERRPSLISRSTPKPRFDAHIILLVFDTAEEMQEWLLRIRREISRLGGPSVEEHPQPSSKAGTIVEEERAASKSRRSTDSSRKNSSGGRRSDEITGSTSTALSHDGLLLDGLRTTSVSSRRGSQGSLNTSPERPSLPDVADRRRSNLSVAYSRTSSDLRLRSRPNSTTLGTEHTPSEPPASPTPTQLSMSSLAGRRSRGNLPPPIPIPVPSIPKRYSSAGSSVGNLPSPVDLAHRRVRRNRKSSAPPSPDRVIELFSTSLPNPQSPSSGLANHRPRPVSLAAAPVTPRKDFRTPNYNRRSVGSVSSSSASVHGPPRHPPPSVPLPRLPDGSPGNLHRLPPSSYHPGSIPPVPQIPIPVPHSPLALHSQSTSDLHPVPKKHSISSLRLSRA
ncbi:hypothetical protein DRE_07555 [Drechslerella stenobrocha 248]|uniref:PH domain-containing protein n=1 Tax=Drechslerella stenobrocha 248 TaxID=1043628 RepID=W7HI13_9PEZI|nr:hypothetical protein DRE_07555 [Drechslerella stenobrocha 248]